MLSKRTMVFIFLFWAATTAFVVYRDVWPRLFASGPPPVAIDLADEATQTVPVTWTIYRNGQKIGRLITYTQHVDADDSFWFINEYRNLELESAGVKGLMPELFTSVRITRGGDLLEQTLKGKMEVHVLGFKLTEAEVNIEGRVVDGRLLARCAIKSNLGNYEQDLDPVTVPRGQPLNPLQPVNRLQHLVPGRSWYVNMTSPLDDAILVVARQRLQQMGMKLPEKKREPLFAQVLTEPQEIERNGHLAPCWVIEYRQDEVMARTWARVLDGRVLRQQAFHGGEQLTIDRD